MHTIQFQELPLFAQLGDDQAAALSGLLRQQNLAAHEALFWIGDPGDEFFVIQSGQIHITFPDEAGRETTLATLGPGDFLGEISLLDGGPRTATARAATDAVLLSLGREDFLRFVAQHPSVAVHMMTELGRRQRDTVDRLRGIRNANDLIQQNETPWQRVAASIAAAAASKIFLISHAIAFAAWIAGNLLLGSRAIDPFPFPFLCFWASCEAIFLSLFILVSQNVQARKDRIRTDIEYQVALKMQVEIMQLHQKIDRIPAAIRDQRETLEMEQAGPSGANTRS